MTQWMKITRIGKTYKHVQRIGQIIRILIRYGFGDLVQQLQIAKWAQKPLFWRKNKEIEGLSREERICLMLQELGPTFVKLGQMLSTRPDLLPLEYVEELASLQDQVAPFEAKTAISILKDEWDCDPMDVLNQFNEKPIAAASIGQVHAAELKDGTKVAIKIQRPQIRKKVAVDLEIMAQLAGIMERQIEEMKVYRPSLIVSQFAESISKELDFTLEASHIEQFRRYFEDDERVYVLKTFLDLCTDRILVLEFIQGTKPSSGEVLQKKGIDPIQVAANGADLILEQIFLHRYFHADPHPGNVMILNDGRICFLDFGNMGRLERFKRDLVADLLIAVFRRDEEKASRILLRLLKYESDQPPENFEIMVTEIIDRFAFQPLDELKVDKFVKSLFDLLAKAELALPGDLFLLFKALTLAEGMGRALDPDFPFADRAAPFIRKVKLERYSPSRLKKDALQSSAQMMMLIKEVPGEIREILKQVKRGKVHMEFEHRGLQPLMRSNERISKRISTAIVLASLIIGSSLIVLSGIPPKYHDIPVIGLAGFVVSGIMALSFIK